MSTNDAHDNKAHGHGLPQDSRHRLNRLREDVSALLDLTRAHQPEEESALVAEVWRDELADSLTALHTQITEVLQGLPPSTQSGEVAGEADDASDRLQVAADPATRDVPSKPYVAGVTLDQIDEMVLLLESLAAHGDVVTAADHAEFAPATLSLIGYSICRELRELRDIVDTIHHDQPQEKPSMPRSGVREEQATYLALLPGRPAGSTSTLVQEHPTYQ